MSNMSKGAGLGKKIKKYFVDIVILSVALIVAVTSIIVYLISGQNYKEDVSIDYKSSSYTNSLNHIFVDVSGSVNKPDLYEASNGARLKDLIGMAGGLSETADKGYFSRNFNLARVVMDQEKIYIPSVWEIQNGYFVESPQIIRSTAVTEAASENTNLQPLINVNSASIEELDSLPGVGKITAQKLIDNRPFVALEDLINKKVLNKSVYENIKNLITL